MSRGTYAHSVDFYASSNWFFYGNPYLYIVAKEAKPGVVFLMNLIVGVIYFIAGELSNLVIVTLIITTVLAEGVRKVGGLPTILK